MRCEIEGQLLEVQGCIERALDIIERHDWKSLRSETSATREYSFSQTELGDVGRVKISILPKGFTELYSYYADLPEEKWMLEYLPSHILWPSRSEALHNLLAVYTWQIENNLFNLTSTELYKLQFSSPFVDWGWEKFGLDDPDKRKQAEQEFKAWRDKVHDLKKKELGKILDVIVTQIQLDGLSLRIFDGKSKEPKILLSENKAPLPARAIEEPPKPPEPKGSGGQIDMWLDWYHQMLENGYKCTLNQVAQKSGYSLGYIKQSHMKYIPKSNRNT